MENVLFVAVELYDRISGNIFLFIPGIEVNKADWALLAMDHVIKIVLDHILFYLNP